MHSMLRPYLRPTYPTHGVYGVGDGLGVAVAVGVVVAVRMGMGMVVGVVVGIVAAAGVTHGRVPRWR